MPNSRSLILILLLASGACAITGDGSQYEDIGSAMKSDVEPLVEKTMVIELTKGPMDCDFDTIRSNAMRAAAVFRYAAMPKSKLYLAESADNRKAAAAAQRWFEDIASAAFTKQHGDLVDLHRQKAKICNGCHDY